MFSCDAQVLAIMDKSQLMGMMLRFLESPEANLSEEGTVPLARCASQLMLQSAVISSTRRAASG